MLAKVWIDLRLTSRLALRLTTHLTIVWFSLFLGAFSTVGWSDEVIHLNSMSENLPFPIKGGPLQNNEITLSVITPEQLNEIFFLIRDQEGFHWDFTNGLCFARSTAAGEVIQQCQNIQVAQLVIFDDQYETRNGHFIPEAKNDYQLLGHYDYHVAPLVAVKEHHQIGQATDQILYYVLDPAVSPDRPLLASEWVRFLVEWNGIKRMQPQVLMMDRYRSAKEMIDALPWDLRLQYANERR